MADPAPVGPAPSPEPRRQRVAGRNLPLAIATALVLAGALLGTLLTSRPAFVAFLLVVVVLALLELLAVLRARATRPAQPVVLAMATVLMLGAYYEGPSALSFGLLLTILAAFAWYLVDRRRTGGPPSPPGPWPAGVSGPSWPPPRPVGGPGPTH